MSEDQLLNNDPADGDAGNAGDAGDAAWDAWSHPGAASRRQRRTTQRPPRPKLTRRARLLIAVVLALIAAGAIVAVLLSLSSGTTVDRSTAARVLDEAHATLLSHQRACSGSDLTCRRQAAGDLSLAYRDFDITVDRIGVPTAAGDAQNTVEDDAELLSNAYDELSVAPTTAAYQRIYQRDDVAGLTATFDRHYSTLVEAIRAG